MLQENYYPILSHKIITKTLIPCNKTLFLVEDLQLRYNMQDSMTDPTSLARKIDASLAHFLQANFYSELHSI